MSPVLFCVLLTVAGAEFKEFDADALEKINAFRKIVGQPALKLDADLSKACVAHAQYLIQNQEAAEKDKLDAHDEDPKLPGFSAAGRKAARSSVIAEGNGGKALSGIDLWLNSYYHRTGFLDPNLARIGVGLAQSGRNWALVIDDTNGKDAVKGSTAVCYPIDKQKDVSPLFSLGWPEFPNPIPDNGDARKVGQPITVAFFQAKPPSIKSVTATLTDDQGKEVEHWLSWPEKPAVKGYGGNLIGLIPKAPLRTNTTYTVQVKAQVNGAEWKKTWSFTTEKK